MIERLELLVITVMDGAAANLERWRQQVVLRGEVFRQQIVILHRFIAGEFMIGRLKALIELRA